MSTEKDGASPRMAQPNKRELREPSGRFRELSHASRLPRIAILASGNGTTAEHLIHATRTHALKAQIGLVIVNNSNADIIRRVKRMNAQYGLDIQTMHISAVSLGEEPIKGAQTDAEAEAVAEICEPYDLIGLFGFSKKVHGPILEKNVVNTHPSVLPETAGEHGSGAQQKAIDLGLGYSGQTLHWVTEEYDAGEVIAEHQVPIFKGDTAETLNEAVMATEKVWLPKNLDELLGNRSVTSTYL